MALQLEIVTPKGSVISQEADEVILPGKEGEFGILEGHIPFLSALRPGVLRYTSGGISKQMAIGKGFAEVGAENKVIVLTDMYAKPGDIDPQQIEQELSDTDAELAAWSGELTEEHQELQDQSAWARARLEVKHASKE